MASVANSLGRYALEACKRQSRRAPCQRSHFIQDVRQQPWRRPFTQTFVRKAEDGRSGKKPGGIQGEVQEEATQEAESQEASVTPTTESSAGEPASASEASPAQSSKPTSTPEPRSALPREDTPDSVCLLEPEIQELWTFISKHQRSKLLGEANQQYAQLSETEKHALRDQAHDLRQRHAEYGSGRSVLSDAALQRFAASEKPTRVPRGFWNTDSLLPAQMGVDEEFQNDDVSPTAHAELEQQREIREYARWVAWELPLLSRYAKPFAPPKKSHPLRFRQTTYLGEDHPAAKKVVVEFDPADIPNLTDQQRNKLIKLAGSRYNPSTGIVKMSAESFETALQNKRFLADTVNALVTESRDGKDTFEDVPFDFRHHTPKPFYEFPKEWIMTPERKAELESRRQAQLETFGELPQGEAAPALGAPAVEKVAVEGKEKEPELLRLLRSRTPPTERPSFTPRP